MFHVDIVVLMWWMQMILPGSAYTPYQRLIPAVYGDGESLPRGVKEYSETRGYVSGLPSPRKISDVVFGEGDDSRKTESR